MIAEVVLSLLLVWFSRHIIFMYLRRRNLPPGPFPYPFLGNIPQLISADTVKPFVELAEKYGDIFTMTFPDADVVILSTDALIREGRIERKDDLAGRSPESMFPLHEVMEGDILTAEYSHLFHFRRKVFVNALHIFGSGREQASERSRNAVDLAMKEIDVRKGLPFSPGMLFESVIIVQIWDWLTSRKLSLDDPIVHKVAELGEIILKQVDLSILYQLLPFLRYFPTQLRRDKKRAKQIRKEIFPPELQEHMKTSTPGIVRDLTDSFISSYEKELRKETENYIGSIEDITGLMLDVAVGGADTTSCSLSWFLLFMVLNPNVQEKLHEELDFVVGRDRLPCWRDAAQMPYMQAALCEGQRASGMNLLSGSSAFRDTKIAGYHVPKGTYVLLNVSKLHLDERVWSEPKRFKPERFLDSDGKFLGWSKLPGFFPFGIGRRECPGQSLAKIMLFIFASMLLHRYKFVLPEGAEIPTTQPAYGRVLLRPHDYNIVAKERIDIQN